MAQTSLFRQGPKFYIGKLIYVDCDNKLLTSSFENFLLPFSCGFQLSGRAVADACAPGRPFPR